VSGSEGPVATIDLGALRRNVAALRARLAPGTSLLAAVKADAYGHGARAVAPALQSFGVDRFGVATAEEALELRHAGVTAPILLFGPVRTRVAELAAAGVAFTVADEEGLRALVASAAGAPLAVHLKLDTGMGRLGVPSEACVALARVAAGAPGVTTEGVWTHLSSSDDPDAVGDDGQTGRQLRRFSAALDALEREALRPRLAHAANSAATLLRRDAHFDMVRPGIAVYGHHASRFVRERSSELEPALTLEAPVTFVKRVRRGDTVGYGVSWTAPVDGVVATVRLGYADGFPRNLGNRSALRLHGHDVPVVGRVCMDQLMLDVSGVPEVRPGDTVVVFGPSGPDTEGLAEAAGTVSYELLTRLGNRVQRRYRGGEAGRA
jgi:alanine racemase